MQRHPVGQQYDADANPNQSCEQNSSREHPQPSGTSCASIVSVEASNPKDRPCEQHGAEDQGDVVSGSRRQTDCDAFDE